MTRTLVAMLAAGAIAAPILGAQPVAADQTLVIRDDGPKGKITKKRERDHGDGNVGITLQFSDPNAYECRVFYRNGIRYRECWPAGGGASFTLRF